MVASISSPIKKPTWIEIRASEIRLTLWMFGLLLLLLFVSRVHYSNWNCSMLSIEDWFWSFVCAWANSLYRKTQLNYHHSQEWHWRYCSMLFIEAVHHQFNFAHIPFSIILPDRSVCRNLKCVYFKSECITLGRCISTKNKRELLISHHFYADSSYTIVVRLYAMFCRQETYKWQ